MAALLSNSNTAAQSGDNEKPVLRRKLLPAFIGLLAAAVVAPFSARPVSATNGQSVVAGQDVTATSTTSISANTAAAGLAVTNASGTGEAILGSGTGGSAGVVGTSTSSNGVAGNSNSAAGVAGNSVSNAGLYGNSTQSYGVL